MTTMTTTLCRTKYWPNLASREYEEVNLSKKEKKKKNSRAVKRRVLTQTIWWNDGGKQAQTELGREERGGVEKEAAEGGEEKQRS